MELTMPAPKLAFCYAGAEKGESWNIEEHSHAGSAIGLTLPHDSANSTISQLGQAKGARSARLPALDIGCGS